MSMSMKIGYGSHTHLADCTTNMSVSVFLVHIVISGSRLISDDHPKDLDVFAWVIYNLFHEKVVDYFVKGNEFSI